MKKEKRYKKTGIKLSRSNKAKFHRSYKAVQMMTVVEPGLSKSVIYDKDEKVIGFVKWVGNIKQSEYTTKVAKAAMEANKAIKQSKKDAIKSILQSASFDPTIKYSRAERKKFTKIVKNKLFEVPKNIVLTKEEIITKWRDRKTARKIALDKLPHASTLLIKEKTKSLLPTKTTKVVKKKEAPIRSFEYIVQRKCSDDPMKVYDFTKGIIKATSKEDAKLKADKLAEKYRKDTSFTSIAIIDSEDSSKTYYGYKFAA